MTTESGDSSSVGAPPSIQTAEHDVRSRPVEEEDAAYEVDDIADNKPRKKRKVIKESDKKYHCPHEECGKAYSRAEHLYRHQLNHTPKQIYRCDFPGCERHFVRADLCARHKERHTAKGSHLQRKDAFLNSQRHSVSANISTNASPPSSSATVEASPLQTSHHVLPITRYGPDESYPRPALQTQGFGNHQSMPLHPMPPPQFTSPSAVDVYPQSLYPPPNVSAQQLRAPTNFTSLPSLPPFGFPQAFTPSQPSSARSGSILSPPGFSSSEQQPVPNSRSNSIADFNAIEQMSSGFTMPVFGGDGFNRSPTSIFDDNFLNSLFNPDGTPKQSPKPGDPWSEASRYHGLDIEMRESAISEKTKNRLAELVRSWQEISHNCCLGRKTKEEILMGDSDDKQHVMSVHMLKTYITSYWVHIHQQMPILHRPTFNPETCPDLLLLAMMCLGAVCLERTHTYQQTQNCAELSFFMAYHIRWEVFKDAEFRPTAKLWTFQTMLLLELFEKMFSTIALHERAHIHHATTLTVMRRGSSLIGRSATEVPHSHDDPTRTPPGPDGSINTSGQNTPDAFWNRWITAEATRRVAFAAFIIDSTHATLFGHSAAMSPHDLRLPLPCDEALWSATSSAEVQRVEASLAANGFKPTTFLEGLKRSLNGQKVRTNTFGRVVIMSGLLNVTWHMNQRDLQVSSLGATNTLGNQIKWRSALTRAFDFWRRDFDESLSKNEHWLQVCNNTKANDRSSNDHRDNVFEARTCLHSLAHMAMHVDIVDCLVFAGSERVLGRIVTDADRAAVQQRMRTQWAPSARARDATFYALRFLCEVLVPEEELSPKRLHPHQPPTFTYSARDDYLLNRPWVMYFALLIIWSYGYALDGPIRPSNYTLTTRELQIFDMQRYLARVGGVGSPDDLEKLKDRNSCLGLLLLLRESFQQPRWELLQEAWGVLNSCVELLIPGHSELASKHLQAA
ncbi:hypothetical protein BAUCODRAFT_75584 [Baudoinia panamericana UAMH 10762]|uniref:C2H2-type domain-containing protein n=1 Tax=Baudoinia panamericana (strain UAMH 10762) TaxID=717646 RepID=M2N3L8_BAUPA|nr:uncharacterized protein BAUCODRAFT_75584 [Baudoinia panamericana UAMH 10762]EMC93320.1 hypothetical protein BAUCODRAFT_75584 [Baudoinia panamericana UAMH 10762]